MEVDIKVGRNKSEVAPAVIGGVAIEVLNGAVLRIDTGLHEPDHAMLRVLFVEHPNPAERFHAVFDPTDPTLSPAAAQVAGVGVVLKKLVELPQGRHLDAGFHKSVVEVSLKLRLTST